MKFFALIPIVLAVAFLSVSAQPKKHALSNRPTLGKSHNKSSNNHLALSTPKSKPGSNNPLAPKAIRAKLPSSLVLLYTSSATGQIRSCNCTKFRFGGYGRELTLLKSIRSKSPDTLLIEGGDVCGDTGFQADLKAKVSAQALALLGYGAIVPGEEELGVRGVRYADRLGSESVPEVCANVFKADETKPLFTPYTVLKTHGGLRVAVIGLMDKTLCDPWLGTSYGQTVGDPMEVLPPIVKQARAKSDLVLLVYHGLVAPDSELAKIKGIDLILATHKHSQERLFPGKDSNIVQAPVGKLGDATLVFSEVSTNWCLGRHRYPNRAGPQDQASAAPAASTSTAVTRKIPAMVKIYEDYNQNVKEAVIAGAAEFKKTAEAMLTKRGLDLVEMRKRLHKSTYATSAKCADCHPEISTIWSSSKHAYAMATLEKTHQDYDPECVRCHTTGAFEHNGFSNAKDTPELANVQCEACHGPAVAHIASPAKGFGRVTEETCRSCHTDERTPDFDFTTAWAEDNALELTAQRRVHEQRVQYQDDQPRHEHQAIFEPSARELPHHALAGCEQRERQHRERKLEAEAHLAQDQRFEIVGDQRGSTDMPESASGPSRRGTRGSLSRSPFRDSR